MQMCTGTWQHMRRPLNLQADSQTIRAIGRGHVVASVAQGPGRGARQVRYMQAPQPVFRAAPYLMELHRQRQQSSGCVIMCLDEGESCRSLLTAAMLQVMLARLPHLDVAVTTASIGPAIPGMRSPNLEAVAAEMDLVLPAGTLHEFDELRDTVRCDLILTMDRFDHAEVQKEVSVLDRINSSGFYTQRIRQLGSFGPGGLAARPALDIADPLYAKMTHGAEHAALRAAVHDIAAACRHLVGSLAQLKARAGASTSLRIALACLLQCPALHPQVLTARRRAASLRRPLWRSEGGRLLTLRTLRGEGRVVAARRAPVVPCGHWRDARSVDEALQAWLAARGGDGGGRLPTQAALRASSANSLSWAVDRHGGMAAAARRLDLAMARRRPNGHWDMPALAAELAPYLLREQEGSAPRLPTAAALVAEGRTDLVRAIRLNGGFKACARKLVMYEEAGGGKEDGVDGRLNLGSPWAARRMPQTPGQARQEGRLEAAAARVRALQHAHGFDPRVMPTHAQLRAAGEGKTIAALLGAGGARRVAAHMGLRFQETRGRRPGRRRDEEALQEVVFV
ncbi:hypothetical protein ACKKBF_B09730 [Auxenochlorella protothecoides x Auxenochlorella symbiontica]